MKIFPRTTTTLPTVLLGYIQGPIRREAQDGEIMWDFPVSGWLLNDKPHLIRGKEFAVTHLQKLSKFGFLITWPFCLHIYYSFKEQQMDEHDQWIPGSETVFYARTPGYRKDIDYGMIWTWGYIGLHWD